MRRYAVSINAHPRLISLGDYQFDKALYFRARAPKNGRCHAYFSALSELNRAVETYSFAGAPRSLVLPYLSPLIRKNIRNRGENRLTSPKKTESTGGGSNL